MAITLLASGSGTPGVGGGLFATINTTGADLLVLTVSHYSGGTLTAVGDGTHTWNFLSAYTVGNVRTFICYAKAPLTTSPSHGFFANGSGTYPACAIYAFSGAHLTAPFDTQTGASSASGTSLATGSITPAANGALVITALSVDAGSPPTVAPTMAQINKPYVGGTNMGGHFGYLVQGTAAAINPTWSWASSQGAAAAVASFLPAVTAAASASASQLAIETLSLPVPAARTTQLAVETLSTLASVAAASARLTQLSIETLQPSPPLAASVTQLALETLQPSPPVPVRLTQLALEVYRPGLYPARTTQLAVEVYHPVLIPARATQAAVEYFQARSARTRVSHAVVEVWTVPAPPTGGGSCPAPFFDPDSDEEWP